MLTDPINSRINGELVVICSTPIRNENQQIVGVLTGALTSDFLFRIINSKEHSFIEYSYLINKGGIVIAHPNQDLVISRKSFIYDEDIKLNELSMIHRKMIKGETGYGFYWYEESEKFVAYTSISDTGWSLALVVPKNKIFSEIDALKRRYISIITILIAVVSLLSIFIFLYARQKQKAVLLQENVDLNAKLLQESIELDRIKTDNFVNISHELRTPINVILATIQMLNQYSLSALPIDKQNLTRHIKSMKKNCLRLIRLVNNLIDTTQIESGYIEINISNYNIVNIVEELTMSVADYFKGKGICLEFDTDVEEKIIACDIDKIERIMLNLLSNAVKFTKEEGTISVRMVDKYDSIIISVKDNGIGIPSDKKEYIFKRFRQIDKSLTRNHEGSGVGLFLVKSLVEMHGGTIFVESELNKGSEFIIELPAKTVSNDNNEQSDEYILDKNHYIERVNTEFSDIYF